MIEREDEFDDDSEREHDAEGLEEGPFDLEDPTHVFLTIREQNVELLQIALQIAGYDRGTMPLKPNDIRVALDNIWKIYSEIYDWVDPEEIEDEETDIED